jgi:hypothetical protein
MVPHLSGMEMGEINSERVGHPPAMTTVIDFGSGDVMKRWAVACVAILCLCVGLSVGQARGQNTAPTTNYTQREYNGMSACLGLTDTAFTNAAEKLQGISLADAKKFYDGKLVGTQKDLALRTVDKVYGDSFTNAWDYAISIFGECAENVAGVRKDRSGMAGYCMLNSLIGTNAWDFKKSGLPVEKVYEYFAKLNSVTPHAIIDRVYASSKSRGDIGVDEWKSCMDPLVSKSNSAPPPAPSIPPQGGLTDKELADVASCVGPAVTVWFDAEQKLQGVRLEDLKKQYESQPESNAKATALRLADKVYSDTFRAVGFYAIQFLDHCAQSDAKVASNRMGVGNSCLRNGYMAATASSLKKTGVPSDKAYEPFAEIYGTMASSIIDKVYRRSASGEDAGVAEWKACVISSPTWTANQKAGEVLLAATPPGYTIGLQNKTEKVIAKHLYPPGETPAKWTEKLSVVAFPELIDHTPTQFQKAVQGPSESCKNGKVISTSVGQESGYAYALWSETCQASAPTSASTGAATGTTEFRLNKAIQGRDNLYLITKSFEFTPSEAQIEQSRAYLSSITVCDAKQSGQPCPTPDAWRP